MDSRGRKIEKIRREEDREMKENNTKVKKIGQKNKEKNKEE
jgi:hypothetical protein